jgi:hypothetical protein
VTLWPARSQSRARLPPIAPLPMVVMVIRRRNAPVKNGIPPADSLLPHTSASAVR